MLFRSVIAEGVEKPEHLQFLAQRNCDEAQGYYFSRPVAAAGFPAAVDQIHRLFDERRLLQEIRPPSEPGVVGYEADREADRVGPSLVRLQPKQVVM